MTGSPHARAHLSIGEVLSLLQDEFPDVTISKIRFLESQGLLDPERTPSGYRKFYDYDIERLRWILRLQKDHYLPLKVIKDRLDEAGGMLPFSDGAELAELERQPTLLSGDTPESPLELPPTEQIPRTEVPARSPAQQARARANDGTTRNGRVAVTEREARSGSGGATAPASAPSPSAERHSPASGTPTTNRSSSGTSARPPGSPAQGRTAGADNARPGGPSARDGSRQPGSRSGSTGGADSVRGPGPGAGSGGPAGGPRGPGNPGSAGGTRGGAGSAGGGQRTSSPGQPQRPRANPTAAANRSPGPRVPVSGAAGAAARPAPRRNPPTPPSRNSDGMGSPSSNGHVNYEPGADAVSLTLDELADASGLSIRDVRDLERFGLIEPRVGDSSRYDGDALVVARTAAGFLQHGIEARHMRAYKVAIDREAGMFQQIVSPLLKQRNPDARVRATRTVTELIRLGEVMRGVLLRRELRDHIGGG